MSASPSPRYLSRRTVLAVALGAATLWGTWAAAQTDWIAAAPLPSPHAFHAATLLSDGTVLVTGGRDGHPAAIDTVARYDPTADRWMPAAPSPEPRAAQRPPPARRTRLRGRELPGARHERGGL